jgi:hypothetical protein
MVQQPRRQPAIFKKNRNDGRDELKRKERDENIKAERKQGKRGSSRYRNTK